MRFVDVVPWTLVGSVAIVSFTSPAESARGTTNVSLEELPASAQAVPERRLLHERVAEELRLTDFGATPPSARYVVAESIRDLRRTLTEGVERTTCLTSLVIKDVHDNLLASIGGRATVDSKPGTSGVTEAVNAAAHNVVSRLPDALRALEHTADTANR